MSVATEKLASTLLRLVVALAAVQAGCVRAGFDVSAPTDAGVADATDATRRLDQWGPDIPRSDSGMFHGLDRDNDTCATSLVVDVKGVTSQPLVVAVNFTGATNDYAVGDCASLPELVLRLTSTPNPGLLQGRCTGGGSLKVVAPLSGACPGGSPVASSDLPCDAFSQLSLLVPKGSGHLLLCRNPQTSPGVTLFISR